MNEFRFEAANDRMTSLAEHANIELINEIGRLVAGGDRNNGEVFSSMLIATAILLVQNSSHERPLEQAIILHGWIEFFDAAIRSALHSNGRERAH